VTEKNTPSIQSWFPTNNAKEIEIELQDRLETSDSIRISYDIERGGWSIKQASFFEFSTVENDWEEVLFIKSFGRGKKEKSCENNFQHFAQSAGIIPTLKQT